MRKIVAAAILTAMLCLLFACGQQGSPQSAGSISAVSTTATTAAETLTLDRRTEDASATDATEPANTANQESTPTQGGTPETEDTTATGVTTTKTTTTKSTTTKSSTSKSTTTKSSTTKKTTTRPVSTTATTVTQRAFGGAPIMLGTPSRSLEESLSKTPYTAYALDLAGHRFAFQVQPYVPASGFLVDVYLYNSDGSYSLFETFSCTTAGAEGNYTIVLVTPDSSVVKDQYQNLLLVENAYRFELFPAKGKYTIHLQATHAPHAATAYYVLDTTAGGFVKFTQ